MADLQDIMTRLVSENRQSRERFEGIASRTVSAITQGNTDDLTSIIRDITGGESSAEPVETGDADGAVGDSVAAEPSVGN